MKKRLFAIGLLLLAGRAEAQNSGLQISPTIIEKNLDPGTSAEETLMLINTGEEDVRAFPDSLEIRGASVKGQPIFQEDAEKQGLASWIRFEEKEIYLKPGERRAVKAFMNIPEDAPPGGHFAGIIMKKKAEKVRKTGAGIGYGVGTIINIRVSGEVIEEAEIESFTTNKRIYEDGEVTFFILVKNKGNLLIRPLGFINIEGPKGEKVSISANPDAGGVFPGGERIFEARWQKEKIPWGKYRAILSLVYGEEERKTISDATEFWVAPVKMLFGILGGALLGLLGIIFAVRRYIGKKISELEKDAKRVRGTHEGKEPERVRIGNKRKKSFARELLATTALVLGISICVFILLFLFL